MAAFLQDSLAVVVIEGLLDQIEMMKRQRIMVLEHIEHAGKCKAPVYEEPVVEPKQARSPVRQPQEFMWAPAPTVVRPPPLHVQPPSSLSTSMPVRSDPVMPHSIQEPDIPAVVENPLAKLLLEPCNEIMADAPAMQQGWRFEAFYAPVMGSQAKLSSQRVESRGLSASLHASDVLGPTKHCQGQKPPFDLSKLDVLDFPDNVPAQAGPAQLLFMHAISIPAPPPQFTRLNRKLRATSKGKGKAVAMIKNESDYGQFLSEDKQESEEGESAAQRFQHMQRNKKLAMKKANIAKAEAAQQHQAINDFSGHIPDGLGVKAKVPTTIVYKYAPRSLPRTPYELEQLYKYYANKHVPQRDHVVMYMLISELLLFAQRLDDNLHDCTMQVILSDLLYQDLKNSI
ncbi:hypothetical protein C0995_012897 [Termitomyces sp. Mi166|nr:hypothetical protein C0995_012897 [Termitomyces sp. Mi166\